MISQVLFSSFLTPPRLVFRGAIASLGLLLLVASNPSSVYSQEQTGSSQPSMPSVSGNASSSRSILKQGSRGDSVSDLQALLKLLGFYTGAIDGVYQDSTASAVAAFQQAAGLQADGVVGAETWTRLLPPSPIVNGAANTPATPTPSSVRATGMASPVNGAIAGNSTAPASSGSFPSPTVSPTANGGFPSPTAQSPSPSVTAPPTTPAAPAASQSPSPRTSPPQTSPPQISPPVSAPVDLPILRVGMRGTAINALQERLKSIGAFKGAIDGVFGLETQEAVKTAQRSFNLEPDGIVGPATWTALLR